MNQQPTNRGSVSIIIPSEDVRKANRPEYRKNLAFFFPRNKLCQTKDKVQFTRCNTSLGQGCIETLTCHNHAALEALCFVISWSWDPSVKTEGPMQCS